MVRKSSIKLQYLILFSSKYHLSRERTEVSDAQMLNGAI